MPNGFRCPNCEYALTLLGARMKFKCSKCGKLFPQKQIEDEHFKTWNKKQREVDKHNIKFESRKPKLTEEEKSQKRKDYYEKNKDKIKELSRVNYDANITKILTRKKIYRLESKEKYYAWRKEYRSKILERTRLLGRIHYFRRQQLKLALDYTRKFRDSFSTYGFSELLRE